MVRVVVAPLARSGLVVTVVATPPPPGEVIVPVSCRLGPVGPALVRLHASADGLGRDACANLNIWLLHTHARLDSAATTAAERCREHPLPIRVCKLVDGDDADTRGIVAAVSGTKPDTPSSLPLR